MQLQRKYIIIIHDIHCPSQHLQKTSRIDKHKYKKLSTSLPIQQEQVGFLANGVIFWLFVTWQLMVKCYCWFIKKKKNNWHMNMN